MRTIEVKMHYTTVQIYKFLLEFGCKYIFIPHFILMYLASFFVKSLAFLLRNSFNSIFYYSYTFYANIFLNISNYH